jgi:hypothetical protein
MEDSELKYNQTGKTFLTRRLGMASVIYLPTEEELRHEIERQYGVLPVGN